MELSPVQISQQSFSVSRRGYAQADVDDYLRNVAAGVGELQAQIHRLRSELEDARAAEDAVHKAFMAASEAKRQVVADAQQEAEAILQEARLEAMRLREEAKAERERARDHAEQITAEARRDALELIEESRSDADELVAELRSEQMQVVGRLEQARAAIEAVHHEMTTMARGVVAQMGEARTTLEEFEDVRREIELPVGPELGAAFDPAPEEVVEVTENASPVHDADDTADETDDTADETADVVAVASQSVEASSREDPGTLQRQEQLLAALQSLGRR